MDWQIKKCSHNERFKNVHEGLNTCFSTRKLRLLVDSYNNSFLNDQITLINEKDKNDPIFLHKCLSSKMQKVCNDETCWLRQPFAQNVHDDDLHHATFKPPRPPGKTAWLSNKDIGDVMFQIRDHNDPRSFRFIGPVPIDFDNITEKTSRFWYSLTSQVKYMNLPELYQQGVRKVGIVFNLDPHYRNGSHWVCVFCEFSEIRVEISYFDSFAKQPPDEIMKLMKRVSKTCAKYLGVKMPICINNIQTQFKDTECGVYCMRYLEDMLQGKTFEEVTHRIISDQDINNWRDYYFRS